MGCASSSSVTLSADSRTMLVATKTTTMNAAAKRTRAAATAASVSPASTSATCPRNRSSPSTSSMPAATIQNKRTRTASSRIRRTMAQERAKERPGWRGAGRSNERFMGRKSMASCASRRSWLAGLRPDRTQSTGDAMQDAMTTTAAGLPVPTLMQRSSLLLTRYWRVPFVVMLALLHMAALRGGEDAWARALMLAHFGFFITWQPFMRGERRLTAAQTAIIAVVAISVLFYFNWWLLALWVSVLAGIVGGKVFLFRSPWLRRFYLVVFTYLVALLLLWVVPGGVVHTTMQPGVDMTVRWGLPALFLVLLAIPAEPDSAETPQIVDFF